MANGSLTGPIPVHLWFRHGIERKIMKNAFLYLAASLLLSAPLTVFAQTNNADHSPFTSASGEADPALVAVAQHSADLAAQGDVYLSQGNYRAAEGLFRDALEVAKTSVTGINPAATRGLAEAFAGEGRNAEAEQKYRDLIYQLPLKWSSDAQGTRAMMGFAALLSQAGKWPEATTVYKNALSKAAFGEAPKLDVQFDPQKPMPLLLQALAHTAIGLDYSGCANSTAAFAEYSKAIRLQPDNALVNSYYGAGWQRLSPGERVKFRPIEQVKATALPARKN